MYRKFLSFKVGLVLTAISAGAMLTGLLSYAPAFTAEHLYVFSLLISSVAVVGYGLIVRARRLSFENPVKSE
ncbi:MAG: hypothetical protein DWQ05_08455 [Calditrichaeota bacterium]|nr:MAG: hypothetical protein DWQ05_08455 [Calditrichota bacterium]